MRLYERHVVSWIVDVKMDLNIFLVKDNFTTIALGMW
jgi:hypothetical protein